MIRRLFRTAIVLLTFGCAQDPSGEDVPQSRSVGVTDQGENPKDVSITRRIRRVVMADEGLSFSAKNTKIITRDGRVTLQGKLQSGSERTILLAAARQVVGAGRVDDQLRLKD